MTWSSAGHHEDVAFRADLRAFLDEELPDHWHGRTAILGSAENAEYSHRFAGMLADRNWLIPHWPDEYGGSRATPWQLAILGEELWSRGEPRGPQYMNANWIGPSIMANGTDEQRRRYLPPIATRRGRVVPGLLRARRRQRPRRTAHRGACSTATSTSSTAPRSGRRTPTSPTTATCSPAPKPVERSHGRASRCCSLDMDSAGLDVRPIRGIVGEHSFCEVFLDDVRVPVANRLGPAGRGLGGRARGAVVRARRRAALGAGGAAARRVRALGARARSLRRRRSAARRGRGVDRVRGRARPVLPGDRRARQAAAAVGRTPTSPGWRWCRPSAPSPMRACALRGSEALDYDSTANHQLRKSMAAGIAAGTYEIQLNLVSRQHLGLPKG